MIAFTYRCPRTGLNPSAGGTHHRFDVAGELALLGEVLIEHKA
jgi:hypothetical protein